MSSRDRMGPVEYFDFVWVCLDCVLKCMAKSVGERKLAIVSKTIENIAYFNPKFRVHCSDWMVEEQEIMHGEPCEDVDCCKCGIPQPGNQ